MSEVGRDDADCCIGWFPSNRAPPPDRSKNVSAVQTRHNPKRRLAAWLA
jgi:hypothetical protein